MISLRLRLTILFLATVFLCIAATGMFSSTFFTRHYLDDLTEKLYEYSIVIESDLRNVADDAYQEEVKSIAKSMEGRVRITIIGGDGKVLADSESEPDRMENHIGRPEVKTAIREGSGSARRVSDTVKREFLYVARKVQLKEEPSCFIRVAAPTKYIDETTRHMKVTLLTAALITVVCAFFITWIVSSMFTTPVVTLRETARRISSGDMDARSRIGGSGEFAELSESLDEMADNLQTFIEDIQQKKSEVENILSSIRDGIVVVDPDGKIILHNDGVFSVFMLRKEELIGKHLLDVVRYKIILDGITRAVDNGETTELEIVTNPINRTFISAKIFPFMDERGSVTGAILTARDVTEIKRLETVRTEFVENASHELRTPVALIRGFVETLLGGAKDEPDALNRFLTLLEKESMRLTNLTEDILSLERAEKKSGELTPELVDIFKCVVDCTESFVTRANDKGVALNIEPPVIPMSVRIPVEDVGLVVRNLVDNAIKFTEQGSVTVRIKTGEGRVILEVEDTGDGIAPEDAKRIFERFYRVDKSRSRNSGGTGLGLSIVKHTVEKWHGTVVLKSVPGKGSIFTVSLPQA